MGRATTYRVTFHLGISLVIFVPLSYLIVFEWYPDFFFATDGGWQGIRIVALVDLVLGPTLTLVVFKAGKPGLKFDLTLIGIFQAICLVIGVYIVYAERPIAMVYADGYFHSVTDVAETPYGEVCMTILLVQKGISENGATEIDLGDLPIEFSVSGS